MAYRSTIFTGLSSLLCLTLLAIAPAGCAADAADEGTADGEEALGESEDAITAGPSSFGYFQVTRRDFRRCAAPLCGGYYVKRVNQAKTLCADGSLKAECYVGSIQLHNLGLSEREQTDLAAALGESKALVKARTYKTRAFGQTIGTLKASEGWMGATGSAPEGTFYRAGDNGIRCITTPCPSTTVDGLNGAEDHNVIDVRLGGTAIPADEAALARAANTIGTREGILLAGGVALPKCRPGTNCGPFATATEFYFRVVPSEGKSCGSWGGFFCNAGQFCNWKDSDICGAFDAPGVCAYRPQLCPMIYKPVCACDGKTYGNACSAAAAGASVSSNGPCSPTPSPVK